MERNISSHLIYQSISSLMNQEIYIYEYYLKIRKNNHQSKEGLPLNLPEDGGNTKNT